MLVNIEITLDDREWPQLTCTVKSGQQVQRVKSLYDVAATKFQPIINNFVSQVVEAQIRRRKANAAT